MTYKEFHLFRCLSVESKTEVYVKRGTKVLGEEGGCGLDVRQETYCDTGTGGSRVNLQSRPEETSDRGWWRGECPKNKQTQSGTEWSE